jgi:hypothetical protein
MIHIFKTHRDDPFQFYYCEYCGMCEEDENSFSSCEEYLDYAATKEVVDD